MYEVEIRLEMVVGFCLFYLGFLLVWFVVVVFTSCPKAFQADLILLMVVGKQLHP